MIIKKFQAKTEMEAILQAKEELGNSAVIMNIKTMKHRGILRLFKPAFVEVTAALEEINETKPLQPRQENVPPNVIEEKLNNLQNFLENQLVKEKESKETKAAKTEVKEVKEKTQMLHSLRLIYNAMLDNEIDEAYANIFVDETEFNTKKPMGLDYVLANIYQKMVLKLGQAKTIELSEEKPKIVFFIGPTGVGKTTTIAKIASKFCIEDKKKVALLTADTYRIAAAEQLKTYANILDIPFKVIYTPDEIEKATEEFKEYDLILIDTAGHSYQNEEQKNEIKKILDSVKDQSRKEVYLVVSAGTKYKDLAATADAYGSMTDYKLIFTKLDETSRWGNILNIRLYSQAELSYITYGQNVPDDIEQFNAQKVVKKLLGGG